MTPADCLCGHARYTHRQGLGGCKNPDCPCDGYQQPDAADELVNQLDHTIAELAAARAELAQLRADLAAERDAHLTTRCERDELRMDLGAAQLDIEYLTAELGTRTGAR